MYMFEIHGLATLYVK